ncbi:uncharacterized protein LOC106663439 [Cimex lectularius]|uniref:Uncharacterized protein n=1 Tax=Cimex lectularius TaxID=79782 RepID=A0A8I6RCX7_CIMLE|nr:uncharacterized protein LOC106663439 [Cimex lectularius]
MSKISLLRVKEKKDQSTCMSPSFLSQFNNVKKKKRKVYPYECRQQYSLEKEPEKNESEEKTQIEKINMGYLNMLKTHRKKVIESLMVQTCWRQFKPEPHRRKRRKKKNPRTIEPLPELIISGEESDDQQQLKPPFYIN